METRRRYKDFTYVWKGGNYIDIYSNYTEQAVDVMNISLIPEDERTFDAIDDAISNHYYYELDRTLPEYHQGVKQ